MALFLHPKYGHLVDAERGIVFAKRFKGDPKPLAMTINRSGYLIVPTGTRKDRYTSTVHRMVWESANGKLVPRGYEVHHLNHVKTDNRIGNLTLVTRAENCKLAADLRRARQEAEKLDAATTFAVVESAGMRSAEDWSEELGISGETIAYIRSGGCIDLPRIDAATVRKAQVH